MSTALQQFIKDQATQLASGRSVQSDATQDAKDPSAIAQDFFKGRQDRFQKSRTFLKDVLQGAARQFAVEGQEVLNAVTLGKAGRSLTPPDKGLALEVYKRLYGTDQPINLETLKEEAKGLASGLGANEETAEKLKAPLTYGFIGLDLIPGFGAGVKSTARISPKFFAQLAKDVAKEADPAILKGLLGKSLQRATDEQLTRAATELASISKPKAVEQYLNSFLKETGASALRYTAPEATKALDDLAEEAVSIAARAGDDASESILTVAKNVDQLRQSLARVTDESELTRLVGEAEDLVQTLRQTSLQPDDLIKRAVDEVEAIQRGVKDELFVRESPGTVRVQSRVIVDNARAEAVTQAAARSAELAQAVPERGIKAESLAEAVETYIKGKGAGAVDEQLFPDIVPPGGGGVFRRDEVLEAAGEGGVERGFSQTVRESPRTSPALAKRVAEFYRPITNKDTLNEAVQIVAKGDDAALDFIQSAKEPNALTVAVGELLVEKFQRAGRIDAAVNVVRQMSKAATSQGQAIQILSLWSRLTPGGVLRMAEKELKTVGKELTPELAGKLINASKKVRTMPDGWQKQFEIAKMMKMVADQMPVDKLKKLALVHTMLLLLNPKTFLRNIIGNGGFQVLENVSDVFAAGLDSAMSLVTGMRTKVLPSVLAQSKGALKGGTEGWKEALEGVNTMAFKTQFDIPQTQVFKKGVGKKLETLLNITLRVPDRAFYQSAYDGSIYQQLKAANITARRKGLAPIMEPTEQMKEVAVHDALYRTFQDDSTAATSLSRLKRWINNLTGSEEFGMGDAILKFPRTPGNLLSRGLAYSPAGFVRSLFLASRPLVGKTFDQKQFVESFARAFTGTAGLFGAGTLLYKAGILTGGNKDKPSDVAASERAQGLGNYQINASALKRFVLSGFDPEAAKLQKGDTLVTYDWFQPAALPIVMGANIGEQNGLDAESFLGQLLTAVADGTDTLVEQPVLQGLQRFSENIGFYGLSGAVVRTLATMPASFVPTLMNQVRQLKDNQSRETFSRDVFDTMLNSVKDRIPGVSETLQPRYTPYGEEIERYQDSGNNVFNVFFNPLFKRTYKDDPEISFILDLYDQTGDLGAVPDKKRLQQTVNGEKMTMGPKQYAAFQKFVGTRTKKYLESIRQDPKFNRLSPEEQSRYIASVLKDIHAYGKIIILGDRPKSPSKRVKTMYRQEYGN